jgi:hypothetical protein
MDGLFRTPYEHESLPKTGWGGTDWIHLAQVRDTWRALENTVMNLWVI